MNLQPLAIVTVDDFDADPHSAKYRSTLDAHPAAARELLDLLNDEDNSQQLERAERAGKPALEGVAMAIERSPSIAAVLGGPDSFRFRQTVGVAIKLKMAKLGWSTTGRKGAVPNAEYFTKAERYEKTGAADTQALAALDAVEQIGDDAERRATGKRLTEALAATRAAEGRAF